MNKAVIPYLLAIVAANLSAAAFGPAATVLNAFLLIGFDFTCRDYLQAEWEGRSLWLRMLTLIAAGGAISWTINSGAGPIAAASTISFIVSSSADAVVFALIGRRVGRFIRWNGTNMVGAAIDSALFPTIAFGSIIPAVMIGQYIAKVAGGALWAAIIVRLTPERDRR